MVKRIGIMACILCFALSAMHARAQEERRETVDMQVYIAQDAMGDAQADRLLDLLAGEFPQGNWSRTEQGRDLRELVLADCAPQLAVCAPGEAMPWAKEGLLLALDGEAKDVDRMQRQAVSPCVWEEALYMAPLFARHRQMAVNERMIEKAQFGYMLDERAHPVWYPSEMYQVLEDFWMDDVTPMEIWPPSPQDSLALEAMVQALYGGYFLTEDGEICRADDGALLSGLRWMEEMISCGMIGMARDRETALNRFLSGETAIFIDWSEAESERHAQRIADRGLRIAALEYPSTLGIPVRAFEVTGAAVFAGGDARQNGMAGRAVSFLTGDPQARLLLSPGAIWEDDAIWLACLDADERGATLRSLFCRMMEDVIAGESDAQEGLTMLVSAMDAAWGE